jgi:OOP family OmpA-OmpF porin
MFKKFAVAAALAATASSAFAAGPTGFYGGVDAGSTHVDNINVHGTSFGGLLGYGVNPSVAFEFGYRRLGSWDVHGGAFDGGTAKIEQFQLTVVGFYPLTPQLDIFGRGGFSDLFTDWSARGRTDMNDNGGGTMYGVGLAYHFTPTVSGRVEFQKPSSDSSNVSLGVVVKF